jgi:hypothetical protein
VRTRSHDEHQQDLHAVGEFGQRGHGVINAVFLFLVCIVELPPGSFAAAKPRTPLAELEEIVAEESHDPPREHFVGILGQDSATQLPDIPGTR